MVIKHTREARTPIARRACATVVAIVTALSDVKSEAVKDHELLSTDSIEQEPEYASVPDGGEDRDLAAGGER